MRPRSITRLLHALKSAGPQTAASVARRLAISAVAVRQHLSKLQQEGLVSFEEQVLGVGRPRRLWSLTEKGHGRFPDSHAQLTLELIQSARRVFGPDGLDRLISAREAASLSNYGSRLGRGDLGRKVRRLALLRSEEGYMAEVARAPGGGFLLIENHCPICAAAKLCQNLCRSELALFSSVMGPGVEVERLEHIVAGARRCTYRIRSCEG